MIKKIKELLVYDRIYYEGKLSILVIILLCIFALVFLVLASQL